MINESILLILCRSYLIILLPNSTTKWMFRCLSSFFQSFSPLFIFLPSLLNFLVIVPQFGEHWLRNGCTPPSIFRHGPMILQSDLHLNMFIFFRLAKWSLNNLDVIMRLCCLKSKYICSFLIWDSRCCYLQYFSY